MRKGIVACIGIIVGLGLLIVAFIGPWYLVNAGGVLGGEYAMEMFLTHMDFQGNFGDQDISMSLDYADAKTSMQSTNVNMESFTTIETARYMLLLAMVTAILSIICMALFVFAKGRPKTTKLLGGLFAFLTFLLTIIPALYFMNTEFMEDTDEFWFSYSGLGMTISGGPGYAWYLAIAVAIIAMICAVAILVKKSVPEPTAPAVPSSTDIHNESAKANHDE